MKHLLLLGILCLPLFTDAQEDKSSNGDYKGIRWSKAKSWNEVVQLSKAENKYIFVDCYATWCAPCKEMDSQIFPLVRVGASANRNFISVKVQMDSTSKDDENVKGWYSDARRLMKEYKIGGFPTYLFFSPDGNLVHKEGGYQDEISFLRLLDLAQDPRKPVYYSKYEAYKKGKKDLSTLRELAVFTKNLIGDATTARKMSRDFITHVLNKLQEDSFMTRENIEFLFTFQEVIRSKDKLFRAAYKHPSLIDSIMGWPGPARTLVYNVIKQEELDKKLYNAALIKVPHWDNYQSRISKKYPRINARNLMLEYKIHYYRDMYIDWMLWAQYKDEWINLYLPKPPYDLEIYEDVNGHGGAWHAFLHCDDSIVLVKALDWVDIALRIDGDDKAKRAAYLDTKANLLYKLGKKNEALQIQRQAVDIFPDYLDSETVQNYRKMQRGQPTWENTIPNGKKL